MTSVPSTTDRMMRWFAFSHLPPHLQSVSSRFHALAESICADFAPGPERTVALRKLLEAKDAIMRADVDYGG